MPVTALAERDEDPGLTAAVERLPSAAIAGVRCFPKGDNSCLGIRPFGFGSRGRCRTQGYFIATDLRNWKESASNVSASLCFAEVSRGFPDAARARLCRLLPRPGAAFSA